MKLDFNLCLDYFDFHQVLVLERPSKASYSGAIVFPGGMTEQVDEVEDWIKFYRQFGVDDTKFKSIQKSCPNRSFIFNNGNSNSISRWGFLIVLSENEIISKLLLLISETFRSESPQFEKHSKSSACLYAKTKSNWTIRVCFQICEIILTLPSGRNR